MSEALQTTKTTKANTPKDHLIAFAANEQDMQQGREFLTNWASTKLIEARQHLAHMEANLEQAKTFSWALQGFRAAVNEARKKVDFYEKLHAAFDAGYCVVPNFPIDVFAVRTSRSAPPENRVLSEHSWESRRRLAVSENLAEGVGEYVSDQLEWYERKLVSELPDGKQKAHWEFWSEAFREVDFPFKTAAVAVMNETNRAMMLKVFDEIGILPARRQKNNDPMVIGRINFKHGSRERTVSFVIAWFLRESDLTI